MDEKTRTCEWRTWESVLCKWQKWKKTLNDNLIKVTLVNVKGQLSPTSNYIVAWDKGSID